MKATQYLAHPLGTFSPMVRQLMDQVFWRRYADELQVELGSPVSACVAGMFQIWIVFFVALMGLLAPAARIAMICLNLIERQSPLLKRHSVGWPVTVGVLAFVVASYLVKQMYWSYRLTPEVAPSRSAGMSRDVAAGMSVALLVGAFVVMALFIWCFWLIGAPVS